MLKTPCRNKCGTILERKRIQRAGALCNACRMKDKRAGNSAAANPALRRPQTRRTEPRARRQPTLPMSELARFARERNFRLDLPEWRTEEGFPFTPLRIRVNRADEIAVKGFGVHPFEIFGESWFNAA